MLTLSAATKIRLVLGVFFCIAIQTAAAQSDSNATPFLPEGCDWKYNPDNGHYYAFVLERKTWEDAKDYAESLGGYLVTITSKEEDEWLYSTFAIDDPLYTMETWIGLHKIDGNLAWVNGESVNYTNFTDEGWGGEGTCVFYYRSDKWYNREKTDDLRSIIEIEPDFYLPDNFDWKYNPDDSHFYAVTDYLTWHEAYNLAHSLGGYLVVIDSESENDWILENVIGNQERCWTGYYRTELNNESWRWVIDTTSNYTNWFYNEPDNHDNYEYYTLIYGSDGFWRDVKDQPHPAIIEIDPYQYPFNYIEYPESWSSLNGDTLEENLLVAGSPKGYEQGSVQINDIPSGEGADGKGLEIKLMPGQGAFITSLQQFSYSSLVHLSGYIKASNQEAEIALIGLNSPIDGQVAYTNIRADEVPIDGYKQFHLIFAPPSGNFQYAIQAVNSPFSSLSTTLWIDNIEVEVFEAQEDAAFLPLAEDGSFEGGLQNIMTNINGDDGVVLPIFESMTDVAIRMSLDPTHTAANIGTFCARLENQYPLRLLGQVNVKRESLPGGGMVAMVITNGFQNLGIFRNADGIKDINDGEDQLIIGGDFSVNNPNIPVSVFVQIGGPNAEVSIIVDDLCLFQN